MNALRKIVREYDRKRKNDAKMYICLKQNVM